MRNIRFPGCGGGRLTLREMGAGWGVRLSAFEPWIRTVPAAYARAAFLVLNVMLVEVLTVMAEQSFHILPPILTWF